MLLPILVTHSFIKPICCEEDADSEVAFDDEKCLSIITYILTMYNEVQHKQTSTRTCQQD